MINNRRGELEILITILELAKNSVKKTEILYQANLSYFQLKNYLSFLETKNLIVEEKGRDEDGNVYRTFRTTKKGIDLLDKLNQVMTFLK